METYGVAIAYALVVLALTVVVLVVLESRRWVRPNPEGPLPDLPPAVVNLLVHRFRVDHDAVAATVVDLGDRGLLDLEQVGPGFTLVRLRRRRLEEAEGPTFERKVVEALDGLAVDDLVPAEACTLGPAALARGWQADFVRRVVNEAERLGLVRNTSKAGDSPHPAVAATILFSLALCGSPVLVLLALHGDRATTVVPGTDWWGLVSLTLALAPLVLLLGYVASPGPFPASVGILVPTRAGRSAAGRWLAERERLAATELAAHGPAGVAVWGPDLARATALGLAPQVTASLPFGAEDPHRVWSSASGAWRPVDVVLPFNRPGWGRRPSRVLGVGSLAAVVLVLLTGVVAEVDGAPLATVLAWLLPVLAVGALGMALVGLVDLVRTRRTVGEVVLVRPWEPSAASGWLDDGRRARAFLGIDDGSGRRVRALCVDPADLEDLVVGQRVEIEVTPWLGYLVSLAPAPATTDGGV